MQNIINYDDKVALYENSDIADINKVNASDMNEIKTIVNGSLQGTNAMGSIVVDDVNCKNLFDFSLVNKSYSSNGITFTNNGDGTFTANGTATAVAYWDIITNMQGTGYYTLSGCPAGGSNTSYMQILMRYSDYNGIDDTGSGATRSFTSGINYGIRLRIASGYVCNNVVFRPMLEKGNTVTPYTPYKKIIKEQNGYVKENTTFYANDFKCRNIYDGLYELGAYNTTTGQKETNNLCYRNVMPIAVKPLTNYVFSLNGTKITETGRIFYLDANGSMLSTETFTGTFTTPANCYYVNWHSTALKTDYPSGLSNTQIEPGSEATPYTPYKNFDNTPVVLFNEPNGQLDDIVLNDNKNNYSYLEVFFVDDQNFLSSIKIIPSYVFQLQFLKTGANKGSQYLISTRMNWSSNTLLKRGTTTIHQIINATVTQNTTADVLKVVRILGYK